MKFDAEGNLCVKLQSPDGFTASGARIKDGELQLKNRSTGLWHDVYIENNIDGDATLTWDNIPDEA